MPSGRAAIHTVAAVVVWWGRGGVAVSSPIEAPTLAQLIIHTGLLPYRSPHYLREQQLIDLQEDLHTPGTR
jgi:hypothetical protein